jgi:transposase
MIDRTTLPFGLPGFRLLNVTLNPDGGRLVLVESVTTDGGCPPCGVMSSRIKERRICRLKDLPHGTVPLRLWVCKRRFVCAQRLCSRGSFTEVGDQVRPGLD